MSELYEKSLRKLELDQVLQLLAECAGSEGGKEACLSLRPSSDLEEVELMLNQTTAASDLCTRKGNPVFGDVTDCSASLERADRGGSLQPVELLRIAGILRCARNIKGYVAEDDKATVLDALFQALSHNKYLEDKIFGAILSEEEIADNASPELSDIRRHMRIQAGKIRDSLQKVISSPAYSKFLREPIITIRQGRYVVPVKSECKNDVPGLVHDVSATGSTYFVEPMSAVNANNALRELELKEKKEIERILAELSSEAAGYREAIDLNYRMLVQLDVIFAKAKLAYRMRAWAPIMNDQGRVELRNARHPLIDPKTVVPISLRLGTDFDTMIITGPNTGGKTVTLKTVGLLTLMAECGLHVPAGDGSVLSTFDAILADIGDEQSIAQSLSTFSSHMRTIVDVVAQCDDRTLVLFDELGAGTDPAEGAALATAIIEFCRKLGSRVVATTHYAELKLYAMRTKGVINASCEFDVETLRPTYKLLIGIPGKSNAFAISKRLGLSEAVIEKAKAQMDSESIHFEDVLTQLEQKRQQLEKEKAEVDRLYAQREEDARKAREFRTQMERAKENARSRGEAEAKRLLAEAKSVADDTFRELDALRKQQKKLDAQQMNAQRAEIMHNIKQARDAAGVRDESAEPIPKPSRPIQVGDLVEIPGTRRQAEVTAVKDGTLTLKAGVLQMKVKADEVRLIEAAERAATAKKQPQFAPSQRILRTASAARELDIRGMETLEAESVLDNYIDAAVMAHLETVTIIHGKGTGALRKAVHASLRRNKAVKSFRLGNYGEGESGVTVVELK